jgi:hypothetical protein
MDADGGVEAEAAAGLPGEHVLDSVLVEEAAALEEAEHAALQRALEAEHVVGREMGRFVEGDVAVVALGEDAVEDDDVEVEVRVEGGAEACSPYSAHARSTRSSKFVVRTRPTRRFHMRNASPRCARLRVLTATHRWNRR